MFALALLAATFTLPPATQGIIQGKAAVLIWPADQQGKLFDPTHCEVHFRSPQPNGNLRFPCAQWFLPPASDRYEFWLEQGNRISPERTVIFYDDSPTQAGIRIVDRLAPAGFLRIGAPFGASETFRILSIDSQTSGFERRLTGEESSEPIRVPVGRAICGIFDEQGNARALCGSVDVEEGKTVVVEPNSPQANRADLLVLWNRNKPPLSTTARVRLIHGGEAREPDVLAEMQSRMVAVWYGVPPGAARVVEQPATGIENSLPVTLEAGRVTTIRVNGANQRK